MNCRIATSLRHAPSTPMPQAELDRMRAKAWTERGLICIAPEEIMDPWARAAIINEAVKRFGQRVKR